MWPRYGLNLVISQPSFSLSASLASPLSPSEGFTSPGQALKLAEELVNQIRVNGMTYSELAVFSAELEVPRV